MRPGQAPDGLAELDLHPVVVPVGFAVESRAAARALPSLERQVVDAVEERQPVAPEQPAVALDPLEGVVGGDHRIDGGVTSDIGREFLSESSKHNWDCLRRHSGLWFRPLIRRGFPHAARGAYGFGGLVVLLGDVALLHEKHILRL